MAELEARKLKYPNTGTEALLMGILIEGLFQSQFSSFTVFFYLLEHKFLKTYRLVVLVTSIPFVSEHKWMLPDVVVKLNSFIVVFMHTLL